MKKIAYDVAKIQCVIMRKYYFYIWRIVDFVVFLPHLKIKS